MNLTEKLVELGKSMNETKQQLRNNKEESMEIWKTMTRLLIELGYLNQDDSIEEYLYD